MGFNKENRAKKFVPLVGFSGETAHSLGEITIPTFIQGVNKLARYLVIKCPSIYNVILGRPWLYQMKAISSTYNQCLKFPTPWRIVKVKEDREESITCCTPVQQRGKKFAAERNEVINKEVDSLLAAEKIREVNYPEWLSNVVVVPKKNGKWRVCVDFIYLNKACPKDPFPLPHIDTMMDATAGHKMLTFLDAWRG
ncbi:uncharacterized protein LOC141629818 [Silene latifolia]|uniref:uncharacterized protein LOC141629818 n=1 Tax=Silene latifolia TaxID=37657 RepID=UPI003D789F20